MSKLDTVVMDIIAVDVSATADNFNADFLYSRPGSDGHEDIFIVLYQIARPSVSVELKEVGRDSKYLLVCPDQAIIFPSATFIRTLISKAGEKQV